LASRVNIRQIENVGTSGLQLISKPDGSWGTRSIAVSEVHAYVDPINGDNSNAKVGTYNFPFKDPWAARDAIEQLSDTVEYTIFWLPGDYTVGDDPSNLKVVASTAESNLHSNTHVINHYLFRGATLKIVTDVISVALFVPSTGNNNKIRVLGNGKIEHDRTAMVGLIGVFLDDTGLTVSEKSDMVLELDSIEFSGNTPGPFVTVRRHFDGYIKVKDVTANNPQTFVQFSPNATTSKIQTNFRFYADSVTGSHGDLIRSVGNTAATQGIADSYIDIDLGGLGIVSSGALVNFYRTIIEDTVINTDITGKADRGGAAGALVNVAESPAVNSAITIRYDGLITDLDTITRIDTTATAATPHPDNNNQITVILNGLVANLNGSQGSTPLINYIYNSPEAGTKVDVIANALLNDRLFFTLRDAQNVTITGNIRTTGTQSPFLVSEIITDTDGADYDFKVLLKDLYVETPDAIDAIDVSGFTGSKILTANYHDRDSVTVITL